VVSVTIFGRAMAMQNAPEDEMRGLEGARCQQRTDLATAAILGPALR